MNRTQSTIQNIATYETRFQFDALNNKFITQTPNQITNIPNVFLSTYGSYDGNCLIGINSLTVDSGN